VGAAKKNQPWRLRVNLTSEPWVLACFNAQWPILVRHGLTGRFNQERWEGYLRKFLAVMAIATLVISISSAAYAATKKSAAGRPACSTYCKQKYGHSPREESSCLAYRGKCDHSR